MLHAAQCTSLRSFEESGCISDSEESADRGDTDFTTLKKQFGDYDPRNLFRR